MCAEVAQVLRLRIRVPGAGPDQVNLETYRVDLRSRHVRVHESRNSRPVTLDFFSNEPLIECDAGVPFDAEQSPISAPIQDYWLDDATVGKDGILQLFEGRAAFAPTVASRPQGEVKLFGSDCVPVHF